MINKIYNNVDFYTKALNGTWERHKAITNNIANQNTPNYKRKIVSFEDQLKGSIESSKLSLESTHEKHISKKTSIFSPITMEDKSTSYRIDGNNVNIDTETADLAKNDVMYEALVEQIIGEFSKIKKVITEGSK